MVYSLRPRGECGMIECLTLPNPCHCDVEIVVDVWTPAGSVAAVTTSPPIASRACQHHAFRLLTQAVFVMGSTMGTDEMTGGEEGTRGAALS